MSKKLAHHDRIGTAELLQALWVPVKRQNELGHLLFHTWGRSMERDRRNTSLPRWLFREIWGNKVVRNAGVLNAFHLKRRPYRHLPGRGGGRGSEQLGLGARGGHGSGKCEAVRPYSPSTRLIIVTSARSLGYGEFKCVPNELYNNLRFCSLDCIKCFSPPVGIHLTHHTLYCFVDCSIRFGHS